MFKKSIILLFVAVLTLSLVACGKDDSEKSSNHKGKLEVKTTVYPLKSFAQQIGGKYVDVESVYPNGVDPHTYDPSQKQMVDIGKSDLFVYTGDNLDPIAKKIAKAINDKDKTLSLEASLDKNNDLLKGEEHEHEHDHGEEHEHDHGEEHEHDHGEEHEHEHDHGEEHEHEHDHGEEHEHDHGEEHEHHHHGKYDPHIWLDPVISQKFAKEIKDELVEKDSEHKGYYEDNYKKLVKDLKGIDKDMKQAVKGNEGKTVYISHDSIGYLADRYNFEQEGVQNMNAEEPSQKDLTNIVKQIKKDNVKHILVEENVSNKVTDTVRKETDAKTIKFYNMGSHTKQQDDDKNSYQSFMKENVKAIEKALKNE